MLDVLKFLFDNGDGRINFEFARGASCLVGAAFTRFGLSSIAGLNAWTAFVGVFWDLILHVKKIIKKVFSDNFLKIVEYTFVCMTI